LTSQVEDQQRQINDLKSFLAEERTMRKHLEDAIA
jgi:hypothetical protein